MYKIFGGSVVAVTFQSSFTWKYIKIIYFFIFKKLFLISAYQNDVKTPKTHQFEANKKVKKIPNFFKRVFETKKQIEFYKTQLKKHVKTASQ